MSPFSSLNKALFIPTAPVTPQALPLGVDKAIVGAIGEESLLFFLVGALRQTQSWIVYQTSVPQGILLTLSL